MLGWDRATVVHARSIEIFEALGLADEIIDPAVKVRGSRLRTNGQALGVLDLALADSRYGFDLGLSEDVVERVLTRYLESNGGAVTRSTRLIGIESRSDGIVGMVEQDGERRDVVAEWIVGCDGHASTTRELARINYAGVDLEAPWAVFDATLEGWEEDFDMIFAHFDIPSVILSPLPGRRWRVYVRPTSDTSDIVSDATVTIGRYAPSATFAAVENPNRFHCHSRVATEFRSGRVLLAGDAAHSCSPSEGHGMNTGLQDAFNLGLKLALACRGVDGAALIDSYENERRPVAMRVVATGDAFEGNQAMEAPSARLTRDEGIRGTLADPSSAHHEAVAAAELDRSYAASGLVAGDNNDFLSAGDLLQIQRRFSRQAGHDALCTN